MKWTEWLTENGSYAHAFTDDDDDEVAACGYQLQGECGECGRPSIIRAARQDDALCAYCCATIAEAQRPQAPLQTKEDK